MAAKKPRRRLSEWNGYDVPVPGAEELFTFLNGRAFACRQAKGDLAANVADVLDAIAWGLNRNEPGIFKALAPKARAWVDKAQPLVAEHTRPEVSGGLDPIARTPLDAYILAVAQIERHTLAKLTPADVARVAWGAASPVVARLETKAAVGLDVFETNLRAYVVRERRMRGELQARLLLATALKVAGVSVGDRKRLENSRAHRG